MKAKKRLTDEEDRRWRTKGVAHELNRATLEVCRACDGLGWVSAKGYRIECYECQGEGTVLD